MKKLRMITDLAMVVLLPVLMGYSLVGELAHEVVGICMVMCFTTHIILNRKWFKKLFKGKYDARRIVTTTVNALLAVCVLASAVSGVFISKHIFNFLGTSFASSFMRTMHLLAAYWGFALMSFHAGSHGNIMLSKLGSKNSVFQNIICVIFTLISLYGIYAFITRGFVSYMFLQTAFVLFDFTKPFILFYLDYFSVMILFMTIGYIISKLTSTRRTK